ncbi:MAG: hypothetical protein ABI947_26555 [Chloroflexota bacterium]
MIDPDDARTRLHELIDAMPDEQITLVWMTFQTMFEADSDEDDMDTDMSDTGDDLDRL